MLQALGHKAGQQSGSGVGFIDVLPVLVLWDTKMQTPRLPASSSGAALWV